MRVLVDKVWPLTLSVLTFLLANAEATSALVVGEVEKAGDEFSVRSLLLIAVGLLTMTQTYSRDTARKLARSEPHELGEM